MRRGSGCLQSSATRSRSSCCADRRSFCCWCALQWAPAPKPRRAVSRRDQALAILAIAAVTALWTQPGDWWRRPWSDPYKPEISERLRQPAIYILLDKPLAYVAPLLPPRSRFYQLADIALPIVPNGLFDRRIRAGLKDPLPGGVLGIAPARQSLPEGAFGRLRPCNRSVANVRGNRRRRSRVSDRDLSPHRSQPSREPSRILARRPGRDQA